MVCGRCDILVLSSQTAFVSSFSLEYPCGNRQNAHWLIPEPIPYGMGSFFSLTALAWVEGSGGGAGGGSGRSGTRGEDSKVTRGFEGLGALLAGGRDLRDGGAARHESPCSSLIGWVKCGGVVGLPGLEPGTVRL